MVSVRTRAEVDRHATRLPGRDVNRHIPVNGEGVAHRVMVADMHPCPSGRQVEVLRLEGDVAGRYLHVARLRRFVRAGRGGHDTYDETEDADGGGAGERPGRHRA